MAQIHHIAPSERPDDARRHLAALVQALEAGTDLGPRSVHIRSLGSSLERMLIELQRKRDALLASPEAELPEARKLLSDVPSLMASLEPLIALARTFPT